MTEKSKQIIESRMTSQYPSLSNTKALPKVFNLPIDHKTESANITPMRGSRSNGSHYDYAQFSAAFENSKRHYLA